MEIEFIKYQACGNDYIYIDCQDKMDYNFSVLSKKLSDRHFGIGGDGVVFIFDDNSSDCRMRMFNSDGSEGKMCGNAIRSVAKYMYDYRGIKKNIIKIQTASGIKSVEISKDSYIAEMGKVSFINPDYTETNAYAKQIALSIENKKFTTYLVSVGNPHAVIFQDIDDYYSYAPLIEKYPLFIDGINVEFVSPNEKYLNVKVWERGSGKTLSCGTGACATAFSAIEEGLSKKNEWQKIKTEGGFLEVLITFDDFAYLKGESVEVFRGKINVKDYEN